MTAGELAGCALLAFGAPALAWVACVARQPLRCIVSVAAAFAWLLAALLAALLWWPLRAVQPAALLAAVALQEAARYLVHRVLRGAERALPRAPAASSPEPDRRATAAAAGLGFGLMSGAFALLNVLADSVGPGTLGLHSGSEYFFVTSAAMTLCMILLNTLWSVVMHSGLDEGNYLKVTWVVGSHCLVSCLTLLNRYRLYSATLVSGYLVLAVTAAIAFRCAGGSVRSLLFSFKNST